MKQKLNPSVEAQRKRILEALRIRGPEGLTTICAREVLDVMHPAARVMELRQRGHRITTLWNSSENAQGHVHRCARYVLLTKRRAVAA